MSLLVGLRRSFLKPRRTGDEPFVPPTLGTPTFVAMAEARAAGDVTCAVPTGTQDGDVMIAFHATSNNQTITPPSGWTILLEQGGATTARLRSYVRVASSEPASYLWDSNAGNTNTVVICSYRDCATTSPTDGSPTENSGTSATVTATGFTTSNDNTMLVMGVWGSGTRTFNDGTSSLGNERADTVSTIGSSPTLGVFDGLQATAGASGNETVTMSGSTGYNAQLIGIKPSGAT